MDFDLTCAIRLQSYDIECAKTNAKLIAFEVGKMLSGKSGDDAASGDAVQSSQNGSRPETRPNGNRTEHLINV